MEVVILQNGSSRPFGVGSRSHGESGKAAHASYPQDGVAEETATVQIEPWMPEHGHGLLEDARFRRLDSGAYEASEVRFHVRGWLDLPVEVGSRGTTDTAMFGFECCQD